MIKLTNQIKRNPTDYDLIPKLIVKKSFPGYGTMYEVYLNKKRIGFADIDHGKTEISFVNINEEYRRKGVSSFLYNYIEKDSGRKLKPSADLLDDGEAFWNARNKRSNPRDEEFLKKIEIRKENHFDPCTKIWEITYSLNINGNHIGYALIKLGDDFIDSVDILSKYQRKDVATYLYDYIEQDLNIKLIPSKHQFSDGKEFWKARSKKNPSLKPKNARPLKTSKTKIPR